MYVYYKSGTYLKMHTEILEPSLKWPIKIPYYININPLELY